MRGSLARAKAYSRDTAPMSIGIVTRSLTRTAGGILPTVREHARGLTAGGRRRVGVYGLAEPGEPDDAGSWAGVDTRRCDVVGPRSFGWSRQLRAHLSNADHDILHLHGLWTYPSVAVDRWRRATRRPTVISPHGMLDAWALANSAWKKRLVRWLFEDRNLADAACLHALNAAEARAIRSLGLRNPIAVIPNGVHLPAGLGVKGASSMPGGAARRTLLFLGRLHAKKGLREAIEAWSIVVARSPEIARTWEFVVAGWDDRGHAAELRALIAARGLAQHVRIVGPLFDAAKDDALRQAAAFILASHSEGLPTSVLEAWAYGLPAFVTDACNLPDGFAHGAAFRITTAPVQIAAVLAARLAEPSTLAHAGQNGRRLVEKSYRWQGVIDALASVYAWLMDGDEPAVLYRE